jgi:hypothetical protein
VSDRLLRRRRHRTLDPDLAVVRVRLSLKLSHASLHVLRDPEPVVIQDDYPVAYPRWRFQEHANIRRAVRVVNESRPARVLHERWFYTSGQGPSSHTLTDACTDRTRVRAASRRPTQSGLDEGGGEPRGGGVQAGFPAVRDPKMPSGFGSPATGPSRSVCGPPTLRRLEPCRRYVCSCRVRARGPGVKRSGRSLNGRQSAGKAGATRPLRVRVDHLLLGGEVSFQADASSALRRTSSRAARPRPWLTPERLPEPPADIWRDVGRKPTAEQAADLLERNRVAGSQRCSPR